MGDLVNIEFAVEDLLAHFLVGAVGLTLGAVDREACHEIQRRRDRELARAPCHNSSEDIEPPVWAGWKTNAVFVAARGSYDREQSKRVGEHVLYIEWWIAPAIHHEGWWRCNPRRPREWTRGRGGICGEASRMGAPSAEAGDSAISRFHRCIGRPHRRR